MRESLIRNSVSDSRCRPRSPAQPPHFKVPCGAVGRGSGLAPTSKFASWRISDQTANTTNENTREVNPGCPRDETLKVPQLRGTTIFPRSSHPTLKKAILIGCIRPRSDPTPEPWRWRRNPLRLLWKMLPPSRPQGVNLANRAKDKAPLPRLVDFDQVMWLSCNSTRPGITRCRERKIDERRSARSRAGRPIRPPFR